MNIQYISYKILGILSLALLYCGLYRLFHMTKTNTCSTWYAFSASKVTQTILSAWYCLYFESGVKKFINILLTSYHISHIKTSILFCATFRCALHPHKLKPDTFYHDLFQHNHLITVMLVRLYIIINIWEICVKIYFKLGTKSGNINET